MDVDVRISLTPCVPADHSTHQILEDCSVLAGNTQPNQHLSYSKEDTEDHLYKIMERYDGIASFSIFIDDLSQNLRFLSFMRDQNPKKEIRAYWVNQTLEGEFYSADDLPPLPFFSDPDLESIFDIVSSLTFLKVPLERLPAITF